MKNRSRGDSTKRLGISSMPFVERASLRFLFVRQRRQFERCVLENPCFS